MSFAYGFGLPHWHALSGAFSPLSLFSGGVQGAFYDPSDPATLFQDRAGTTPCGTPGQGSVVPVGLMLDKSQGLVLGSELVSGTWANGTAFPFDTFTASGTGFTGNKTAFGISQAVLPAGASIASGAFYRVEVRVTFADDEDITVSFQNASGGGGVASSSSFSFGNVSSATTIVGYVRGTSTGTAYLQMSQQGTNRTLTVASVSVKLIAGNHAIAANDTTARPELRARVNLITNSENLAGTGWSGTATVATDVTTAPNGTTTADSITAGSTGTFLYVRRSGAGLLANVQFTWSVFAKKNTSDWVALRFWDTAPGVAAWFNLATGAVGTVQAGCTASISDQGNGWYRCVITRTMGATLAFNEIDFQVSSGDNTNNATAGNSIFLWGAQLTATNEFPANTYQRIVDANTYDAVGFPRYFVANGTSSAMSTPGNVNLSGTDKVTVFAGVRKLSDAAVTVITELSANAGANAGTFFLTAPGAGGAISRYGAVSRGSVAAASFDTSNLYPAPISNVLTLSGDIPADVATIRVNGVQTGSSSADQGTGNFGTYPLFIGARNNASLFFTGNIYSLIVVGSAVSAGQISATEQWVAGKTGITI